MGLGSNTTHPVKIPKAEFCHPSQEVKMQTATLSFLIFIDNTALELYTKKNCPLKEQPFDLKFKELLLDSDSLSHSVLSNIGQVIAGTASVVCCSVAQSCCLV